MQFVIVVEESAMYSLLQEGWFFLGLLAGFYFSLLLMGDDWEIFHGSFLGILSVKGSGCY